MAGPQRGILQGFTDWLSSILGNSNFSGGLGLSPNGNYSGSASANARQGGILYNPWGVSATVNSSSDFQDPRFSGVLAPGQSLDLATGRLSDPKLHASASLRLNEATQMRKAQEAGLNQASKDSARGSASVLASLDELYLGNTQTTVSDSKPLSEFAQAQAVGFNEGRNRTILGAADKKKPIVKPARSL